MKATESIIQPMLEGTKQYLIPLFQRTYSWSSPQWKQLWEDILDIEIVNKNRGHFIGSIVSMSLESEPHEVQKYLIIDGQQRLTTLSILLAVIRDIARDNGDKELSEEIHENLLVNKWKSNDNFYKILPTQVDRKAYKAIIDSVEYVDEESNIKKAYEYFKNKISKTDLDIRELKTLVSNKLSIVSIVLASDDNPYLVFESLNAKGRPLTQANLIRNYFFMRISNEMHEQVYQKYWKPMQDIYQDSLTEYIRHFLMRNGKVVRSTEVYLELKNTVNTGGIIEHIKELHQLSLYYECILNPNLIGDLKIRNVLHRLNRLDAGTSYPFILNMYTLFKEGKLLSDDFVSIVNIIENYLIRRFVCNIPTNELNKIFPLLIQKVNGFSDRELIEEIKAFLQNKGYPKNQEFKEKLLTNRLYGSGDRARKTKFILESLEESYKHKEKINYENLTIEHIMPQTLSDSWKISLGENWENIHDKYVHVLGNLSLTAYNSEMSNEPFQRKLKNLAGSHLEINKTFRVLNNWGKDEIIARTNLLADMCLHVWSYFGSIDNEIKDVKGTTPRLLNIFDKNIEVTNWREVWIKTLNESILLKNENFSLIQEKYPNLFSSDINKFKRRGVLINDMYVNVDFSARDIYRLSLKIIEIIGVPKEEWNVEIVVK